MPLPADTVSPRAKIEELIPILNRGMVAIIAEGDEFYGIVTRIDVVNYLKSSVREH
jgi:cystathionine beta-synthase